MKPTQMEIHRDWKIVVQPSLPKPTLDVKDFDPSEPPKYYILKWPPWLQENIMHFRDEFIRKHEGVIPNVVIVQDSYLATAQFYDDELKEPKSDRVKKRIKELYEKLEEWQGQMLFEWYGLKVYNRHHVIGNRDLPYCFLEVR